MSSGDKVTNNSQELGQRLRDTRNRLGLSQAQLANILGVSVAALSRWEHGNRNPRAKHLETITYWLLQQK